MHISILTASGKYNLGDELILREEFFTLKKAYPDATFSVFTYDQKSCIFEDEKVEFISFFPNRIKSDFWNNLKYLRANIRAISKSDFIVIGGGGLIYDREKQRNMFPMKQWIFRVFLARFFKVPILWWSVGINVAEASKRYLPYLFGGKRTITSVRDKKSYDILLSLGIESTILPDIVLGYIPERFPTEKTKKIGLSLRSGYAHEQESFFAQLIAYLREKGYQLVFLSQSIHPENIEANDEYFASQFAKRPEIVTKTLPQTLTAYESLDFVIGMRLHSLILATAHHIPFLALSYETKTKELMKDLDYEYTLDVKKVSFRAFKEMFEQIEANAPGVKFALGAKNDTIKGQLEEGKHRILSQIDVLIK